MDRPSASDPSDRSATKRSVQQSLINRPVHSERSSVTPGPGNTGTGQTGTGTRYPVTLDILGTPGQTRRNPSHPEHRSHWVHRSHRAILPWARYCRIDPLGLNQNAQWTDLLQATGLTGQLLKGQFSNHRSADQCTLNIHRSHRDSVIPVPVTSGILGTPGQTRRNRSHRVHRSHWVHRSDWLTLVRKLKRYRPTSAWTSLSYLFLIHRSDRYN